MKHQYTIIFLLFPFLILNAQNTYVPDDNFEQRLIILGLDDVLDNYVLTSNISNVYALDIQNQNISDLTGLEDFASLISIYAGNNQFSNIPLHPNVNLNALILGNNQVSVLNLSQHTNLTELSCPNNNITSLDLSQNTSLMYLNCGGNSFPELNLANHQNLREVILSSQNTALENVDIRNGNNTVIDAFEIINSPNLPYIYVDDCAYSTSNWTNIDPNTAFVEIEGQTECELIGVEDNFSIQNFTVYPNPVNDFIFLKNENTLNIHEMSIFSISGEKLKSLSTDFNKIDFKSFYDGVYYLKIQTSIGTVIKKVIKT